MIKNDIPYDISDPLDIFRHSRKLLSHTLREFVWEGYVVPKGKGSLGQMVENIHFLLETNSNPAADFAEAGLELKCTPLLESKKNNENSNQYLIKERLVCNMINYFEVINEDFEKSHFYLKCQLMLLLFYLHQSGANNLDLKFLFSVLWKLPPKDLLIIKHDYKVIVDKIIKGEAHLLSEGDTEYLGACRKGQKGQKPVAQPNSKELAPKRAFSLKPAYMRTILEFVLSSGNNAVTNYKLTTKSNSVVSLEELQSGKSFEEIVIGRFNQYLGLEYKQLCEIIGKTYDTDKSKYYHISSRLINKRIGSVNATEEFRKAGLQLKTIRIEQDGGINESMSFENIDYQEVYDTEDWLDSRLYEIFSGRFLFVLYKADGGLITYYDKKKGSFVFENSYSLYKAFFWTMPADDLQYAEKYWNHIRNTILDNHIDPKYFNSENNHRFHVRPKGENGDDLTINPNNPNGKKVKKYCYWFNNEYVKKIVESNE